MKTCFVRRYNVAVNDPDLKKVGVFNINVTAYGGTYDVNSHIMRLGAYDSDVVLKASDGGYFLDSNLVNIGNTVTLLAGASPVYVRYSDFNGVIEVQNKNEFANGNVATIAGHRTINAEDLQGTKVTSIVGDGFIGKVSELPDILEKISITDNFDNKLKGDISDFTKFSNLEELSIGNSATNIKPGDISILGVLTHLKSLAYHYLSGSIESFVAAQINAGRTTVPSSDPIKLFYLGYNTSCTYNGEAIAHSPTGHQLYWSSISNITLEPIPQS